MLLMDVNVVVLILGGVLAISGLIVSRKPDAKQLIDKLAPYQVTIGLALIVLGLVDFIRVAEYLSNMFKANLLLGAVMLTVIGASILLGALFGAPQILKWMPNPQAQEKANKLVAQVAPFQVILGLVGIFAALIYFLYRFHLLTMSA